MVKEWCAYMDGRRCTSDCMAYSSHNNPTVCSRLNNEERIADTLEAMKKVYCDGN